MAKFNFNNNLNKADEAFVAACTKVTMKFHGRDINRAFTAIDEGRDDGSLIGGLVINPESFAITGAWEWDRKNESNVRFLSFKEVDEQGNFRLHKGGSPVCNAIRKFVINNTAA